MEKTSASESTDQKQGIDAKLAKGRGIKQYILGEGGKSKGKIRGSRGQKL